MEFALGNAQIQNEFRKEKWKVIAGRSLLLSFGVLAKSDCTVVVLACDAFEDLCT